MRHLPSFEKAEPSQAAQGPHAGRGTKVVNKSSRGWVEPSTRTVGRPFRLRADGIASQALKTRPGFTAEARQAGGNIAMTLTTMINAALPASTARLAALTW